MSKFSLTYLGIFSLLISILSFFNIIYSYYFNLYLNLDNYLYSLLLSLLLGCIFLFKKKDNSKISIYHKILCVFAGYIVLPIIISIPYFFSIYNISFIDSYFEAISGFTSTGFTIFENIKNLDESLILWRSSSQWLGGLYFLFSIVLLIDIFDNNFKKSLTNFLTFNTSETLKQSLKILILYSSLTFIIFLILNSIDLRSFVAFNISMTLISSGGFLPVDSLSVILNSEFKEIVFSLLMLSSFFSIFLVYNLIFIKSKNINFFQEDLYLFFYLITLIFIFIIFFNFNHNFSVIFLSLISSISNIGLSLNDSPQNLSFVLLILIIIGGSFFSTSSGLRFIKLYSLFKYSINNLLSHSKPKNIFINKLSFSEASFDEAEVHKYFLSVLIFVLSLFFITCLLTINGFHIEDSFKLGILTLMNTVNSSMLGNGEINFQEMSILTKYYLMIFMIIGRVELLTLLIICKKFFFKN
jgi:trk system potassium uptake protein TrkH